jgi:hypothetical protein
MAERRWTLEAARALLPDVRRRTERAFEEAQQLLAERDDHPPESPAWRDADGRVRVTVDRWAREMEALGLEVKGLWLVDFDSGAGFYCWRWPETELGFFHGYEEGFDGRVPIQ